MKFWRSGTAFADKTGNLYVIIAYTLPAVTLARARQKPSPSRGSTECVRPYMRPENGVIYTHWHTNKWDEYDIHRHIYTYSIICHRKYSQTFSFLRRYIYINATKIEGKWRYMVTLVEYIRNVCSHPYSAIFLCKSGPLHKFLKGNFWNSFVRLWDMYKYNYKHIYMQNM